MLLHKHINYQLTHTISVRTFSSEVEHNKLVFLRADGVGGDIMTG